ncbi:MAG: hypothetical protein JJT76_07690 [Clostridiaceae bacterium]|nr:hypothetical protein [Clostridiaceae bacterium]
MEQLLKQILEKVSSIDEKVNRIENKLDSVYNQTADLTEFKTQSLQNFSDIKDTLKFVLHKEIETEKEIFTLKQANQRK